MVHAFLGAEFFIKFGTPPEEIPQILSVKRTAQEAWSFDSGVLGVVGKAINWTEEELLDMILYGGYKYLSEKPLVSWFAPHSPSLYKQWAEFEASVSKEKCQEWM